ncbi:MoaD/ThiS family protein [Spongisporangium articulatum]|uniref:MoaD/ThiS family protein n=1 Tax=Spongisporangium articulatum TaxID=3362603 RepID=A0ABW8AU56_9ACTN
MNTVRYFAAAAAAAGCDEEKLDLPADLPLTALVEQLSFRYGPKLSLVLASSSFLIDGVAGSRERSVPAGATVDVLPPFAGG